MVQDYIHVNTPVYIFLPLEELFDNAKKSSELELILQSFLIRWQFYQNRIYMIALVHQVNNLMYCSIDPNHEFLQKLYPSLKLALT